MTDIEALRKLVYECIRETKGSDDMLRKDLSPFDPAGQSVSPAAARFDLEHLFTDHPPNLEDMGKHALIRNTAKFFAQVILDTTPPGKDQERALNHIRDAVMIANAAIALRGRT